MDNSNLKLVVLETEQQAKKLSPKLAAADHALATVGREVASLLIIILALVNLVAPIGIGLAATWLAWIGALAATGSRFLAWAAGILMFAFLCRYVWGSRLQLAARRAAEALVASRPN